MSSINLAVFGTSLMWGQGLEQESKIHSVLARLLQAAHSSEVNVAFLAHSGASTGYKRDGSIDTVHKPKLHGEVPTEYPTILQEIDEFDELGISAESINGVILDAGINDVHVTSILDPRTSPHHIEEGVEIYCYQHMKMLIARLMQKFVNANVIIVGYYEFITEQSEEDYVHDMLQALARIPGGVVVDAVLNATQGLIRPRILANCDAFAQFSTAAFQRVADELNHDLSQRRVFIAKLPLKPENAAYASDPWLFAITPDFSPEDPVAKERVSACHEAPLTRTAPGFCEIASAGHPNEKGAQAYAKSIFDCLENQVLT